MRTRIDLHAHSRASGDTHADAEEMVLAAIALRLHGIAFTEHYSYAASAGAERLAEKYRAEILVLRGVEYSAAEGHCLVFGADTDRVLPRDAPLAEVVARVREAGGVVIPSHPYRGANSVGDLVRRVDGLCAIEGRNGNNLHALNARAVEAAAAAGLPCTGGSDAHDPRGVGSCFTEFEGSVTRANLLERLRGGRYVAVDLRKVSRGLFGWG